MESFNTRLLMSVHGIPPARLERSSILTIVQGLVRDQLRALAAIDIGAESFDEAAEELRALTRMLERRRKTPGPYEKQLAEIEQIKRSRGLAATKTPDVSRAVALTRESAALRSPGAGIEIRDLWREGDRKALVVKMPAGSKWPGLDYHIPGPEEVYVISGDLNDGPFTHTEGTFIHYPAGSSHAPSTQKGCTLFVFYPEG